MSDLTTVPSVTDRKEICDQGIAMQNSQSFIEDESTRITNEREAHVLKCIVDWCRITDVSSQEAINTEINMLIDGIRESTLDQWESELNDKGYTVVRSDNLLTVKLSS